MLSRQWLLPALLAAPAACQYPTSATFQLNGLNVYASSDPFVCTSQTNGPGYFCSWLQNDGNFVVYWYPGDGTRFPAFASATDRHNCPNGANNCQLIFQGDGNLVIYINGQAKWASNTVGDIGDILYFSASNPPLAIMHNNGDGTIDWPIVPHAVSDPPDGPYDYTSHEISGVSIITCFKRSARGLQVRC
ncbi:hypothetical protein F5B17DRAFT_414772 [Nemania serpens]|nr:hypothetical protein F5B17DRAFT_414772 [Nemania serpens]